MSQMAERDPCESDCKENHQHYFEEGCLAALTHWPTRKVFLFCAPGTETMELKTRPREMLIDESYLRHLTDFANELAQMVVDYDVDIAC